MFEVDWSELLIPSGSLVAIAVRGTAIYLVLFLLMRFLPRRTIGQASASDLLIIVLIADAVQNGMADEYRSITEGLLLAAVIIGWALLIDWLDYRFPRLHLATGREVMLIEDGQLLRRNMARQLITEDEVLSQLRLHGLDSPAQVRKGFIEGDGHFTLLLRGNAPIGAPPLARAR
jgi:uncharacterized membrane protein YcaP (DUF421 family)